LVGRSAELAVLADRYESAARGKSQTVIVEGDAGVGKSRLLDEFLGRVRLQGGIPLVGRCADVEGGLPFGPVVECLRELISRRPLDELPEEARLLGALLPEVRADPKQVTQTALFHGIARVLAAAGTPLAFVFEDAHWSDESTRELTRFLVDRLDEAPVVLVLSVRSDEPYPPADLYRWLGELKRNPRVHVVTLAPLARDEVARQIEEITGSDPSATLLDSIYKRSQGNPFFVEELLVAGVEASPTSLPSLADLFLGRVARLEERVRDVLRAVAVADRPVSSDQLAQTLPERRASLGDLLRSAVAAHILRRDERGGYSFRHALLRDLFYEELTSDEQRRYHAAFATALSESSRDGDAVTLAQIAHHWREADDPIRARAASLDAGRAAERSLGYAEAVRHLSEAAELSEALDINEPPVHVIYEDAATAAGSAGEWARSAELLEQAIRLVDPSQQPERAGHLMERLAWCHWWALGTPALSLMEEALELVPAEPATSLYARILRNYAIQLESLGDFERIDQVNRQAIEAARRSGDPLEEGKALLQANTTLNLAAAPDLESAVRGFALIKAHGTADDILSAAVRLGNGLLLASDFPRLLSVMEEAIALGRDLHVLRSHPGLYLLASNAIFFMGKWDEAQRFENLFLGIQPPGRAEAAIALATCLVRIGQGRFDDARARLEAAGPFCREGPAEDAGGYMWELLLYRLWSRDLDRGWADVRDALELLERHPHTPNATDLYLVALQIGADRFAAGRDDPGDVDVLDRCIESARASSEDLFDRFTSIELDWCEAEYERAHGRYDVSLWERIAEAWTDLGVPWFEAWTRWRAAEALLISGESRAAASQQLARAHELAHDLGAAPLLAEVEALATRARLPLQDRRGEPTAEEGDAQSPVDRFGLTARELEVLRLVANGKSNPEIASELFISRKTASAHVSHILDKLGVSRRVEAATMAHAMGLAETETR